MATVDCTGVLVCADGFTIPLGNTMAEGTQTELQTSTDFTQLAQSAGVYATQAGRSTTVVAAMITAENQCTYAYIYGSGGNIKEMLPTSQTCRAKGPIALMRPTRLEAGDTVQVMTNTATDREFCLVLQSPQQSHAFSATPSGAGQLSLTSILGTSKTIGEVFQGQVLTGGWGVSTGEANIITPGGGALIVNGAGTAVGAISAIDTQFHSTEQVALRIPIGLSFSGVIQTDA